MAKIRKPLVWLSGEVKTPPFSKAARIEAGALLGRLQVGELLAMPESRPLRSIGPRCHELRIQDVDAAWRVVSRLDPDAVVVVHVLAKKQRRTPLPVLDQCRRRLARYDMDASPGGS